MFILVKQLNRSKSRLVPRINLFFKASPAREQVSPSSVTSQPRRGPAQGKLLRKTLCKTRKRQQTTNNVLFGMTRLSSVARHRENFGTGNITASSFQWQNETRARIELACAAPKISNRKGVVEFKCSQTRVDRSSSRRYSLSVSSGGK